MQSGWLTEERLRIYPKLFLALYIVLGTVWVLLAKDGVDLKGKPLGYDFITFWGASYLALEGAPENAYVPQAILEAEQVAVPASEKFFLWHYPPLFYLVVLPLALMPYWLAYLSFVGTSLAAYVLVLRRIAPVAGVSMLVMAFPGTMMNLFHGQNAFITAALVGAALHLLTRKPMVAGVLIGLLCIKPHLGLLLPMVLVLGAHWRTFWVAAATVAVCVVLSYLIIGKQAWLAFIDNFALLGPLLEEGALPWGKMPTVFAFLRILGVSVDVSYLVHFMLAIIASGMVAWVWVKCDRPALCNAALVTGTLLVSPYLFDYDLVWLGLAIAWLAMDGLREGFLKFEREMLVGAWVLPMAMAPVASALHVQVGPFVVFGLLCYVFAKACFVRAK